MAAGEDRPIPASVWRREHHAKIFRSHGPCARCQIRDRVGVCGRCVMPMCGVCLVEHMREECHQKKP
jgi:hypothetical protein